MKGRKYSFFGCCCCWVTSVVSDSVWSHRRQPSRLPHPWDSQDKNTGVGCHFLLQCMKVKVKSPSHVWLLATPWTATQQAPQSMGFSRQEYWIGMPLPSPSLFGGQYKQCKWQKFYPLFPRKCTTFILSESKLDSPTGCIRILSSCSVLFFFSFSPLT